ncbi:hypothetical protein QR680_011098 [Steinernema hermaphroditum]|uniref:RING-type domain-containing protein n=1 Tax=Steinernema hermaphroditum TaxID=289476 RepID=A0AA39MCS4_9BILA|nr:hypothetical protein QR680_011098 [Steinernema hermaphroditum]
MAATKESKDSGRLLPKVYFCHVCEDAMPCSEKFECVACRNGFVEEGLTSVDVIGSESAQILDDPSYSSLFEELPTIAHHDDVELRMQTCCNDLEPCAVDANELSSIFESMPTLNDDESYSNIFHGIPQITSGSRVAVPSARKTSGGKKGRIFEEKFRERKPFLTDAQIDAMMTKVSISPPKHSECPVCMEELFQEQKMVKLNCVHVFHRDCIVPWLKRGGACPICRSGISDHS